MKDGTENNVFVLVTTIKSMEFAEHAILTHHIMDVTVFVTTDTMETLTNVKSVTLAVDNAMDQALDNVRPALMSALISKTDIVLETHHAQLDSILIIKLADLAHLIVILANQKVSVQPVLKVSKNKLFLSMELKQVSALKNVVTEKDSKSNVTMETIEMVMVAMLTVRSKKDGIVKEDLALSLAHVSHSNQTDHMFQLPVLFTYSEELFKVLDLATSHLSLPKTNVLFAPNFYGSESLILELFLESELIISPRANINS